jgi:hypothetical protein
MNKEQISKSRKIYNLSNKEQIQERRIKSFVCECGLERSYSYKAEHLRTKIHNDLMLCKNVTPVSV